jgi:thiosulfate dehydrogenase [quinone] large subunit
MTESNCAFFFNKKYAWVWLLIRLYLGYEWLSAGIGKITSNLWVGSGAGTAITGFLNGALTKTAGEHPDVSVWYAWFINHVALPHSVLFSYLVAFGEVAVGLALIFGLYTGVAAAFGAFMNTNYLWAGVASINTTMLLLEIGVVLAYKIAGWYGLDRLVLPKFGQPWQWFKDKRKYEK